MIRELNGKFNDKTKSWWREMLFAVDGKKLEESLIEKVNCELRNNFPKSALGMLVSQLPH